MQGWEKGEAEGREKGEAEGRKMGHREEAARLFLELYATKFAAVPDEVSKQAASASQDQLETWAKRLLTAHGPEDVFKN